MPTFWIIFWITSESPVFAEDELSFSVFPVAEDEQSLFFFASFWNFFFRMLADLEHGILLCVAMELQRRGGSQSLEDNILIWIYGLDFRVSFFVFFFSFFLWRSGLVFFFIRVCVLFLCSWISGLVSESECLRHTVWFFLRITLYVSVFEGGVFANVSTPSINGILRFSFPIKCLHL